MWVQAETDILNSEGFEVSYSGGYEEYYFLEYNAV
jgi:hypothetical protein